MINSIDSGNNIMNYINANARTQAQETKQEEFERILEKAVEDKDDKKLRQACRDMEAVFVSMMFKQMRSTVQKSGLFGGGYAEEMYEDMLFEKYAEEASKSGSLGLGDMLYRQLSNNMKKESEKDNVE